MDNKNLNSRIAFLETKVDMLESELQYLNEILTQCGFPEGIATLKATVEDLLQEDPSELARRKKTGWDFL
jgi:uncharacterized coiled-coil protein SlyX